jgi:diguanylate cyclase (GGDEF)-like protein/PAS domain S-box-containing protein
MQSIREVLDQMPAPSAPTEQNRLLEDAMSSLPEAILLTTGTRMLYINPEFTRLFGYTLQDISDREISSLSLPNTQAHELELIWQIVETRGRASLETVRMTKDGSLVDVALMCAGLKRRNGTLGYIFSFRDIRNQKQDRARLQHFALHDVLTGLPNRALFLDRLKLAMARRNRRHENGCGVMFLDLDKFKEVNDSRGHSAGDALLAEVAKRLTGSIRPQDTAARLSGDEFALLLDSVQTVADMSVVAARVLSELERPFDILGHSLQIGASIGVALCGPEHQVAEQLVRDADFAMYRAKQLGGRRFEVFDRYMQVHISSRQERERELRRVLDKREFAIWYQPFFRLRTGVLEGFEALLRWRRDDGQFESFQDLLSTAEGAGLSVTLNRETLKEALIQMHSWSTQLPNANFTLSLNLSKRQFYHPELLPLIDAILSKSNVDPSRLMFEVPEGALNAIPDTAIKILQQLSERGPRIAVDNFGSGLASVNHLAQMPLDVVKFDPRLTATAGEDGRQSAVLRAMVDLGASLGLQTVAQCVEHSYQREALKEMECDMVQGFLFAPAVSPESAGAMITRGGWADAGDVSRTVKLAGRGRIPPLHGHFANEHD